MLFKDSYFKVLFHTTISIIRGWVGPTKKRLKNRAAFKGHTLYLSLPVVVQLLHRITAVNEGGD